ncbi:hypothetical protein K469DRAFT_700854 [Zopfia rhizophila CBS 207.26]|uniref:Uncharacterized protein n=1 Tax=Zopfia rhizophila CBS 207.26 TaxID=1314779 RepID=A0A6A6ECP9_9PEZI|nr:hypothetical protein K469DRAFT_700854 [Zopfia rhizophila CBS 207.26]
MSISHEEADAGGVVGLHDLWLMSDILERLGTRFSGFEGFQGSIFPLMSSRCDHRTFDGTGLVGAL